MNNHLGGLTTQVLGHPSFYHRSVDSTNNWLKLSGDRLPHGTLCWTDCQTEGRGRLGREWIASPGMTLAMSLLFKPSPGLAALPLICGMAVSRSLSLLTGKEFLIKWPNDIICDDLKICGILCENCFAESGSFLVAGIGINFRQTADEFIQLGLPHAGSLSMLVDTPLDMEKVAAAVINQLEPLWLALQKNGFGGLHDEYEALCINIGKDVRVLSPNGSVLNQGTAVGIAPDGCLLVDSGSGILPVNAGEVSVRGIDGYV